MSEAILEIEKLSKAYGRRQVLQAVDLRLAPGEALCLCGSNGAGKSTLLNIIAGLLRPTRGRVRVCGLDQARHPEKIRPLLGVIAHQSMIYEDLTVEENLLFYLRLYRVPQPRVRVESLLREMNLSARRQDRAGILSRGLLQRLTIARALGHQPRLLLADEPFTGLDLQAVGQLAAALAAFRAGGGAVLMTAHETAVALPCCDRVAVLDGRKIIFDALAAKLDTPRFVTDYLVYARQNI